MTGLQKFIGNFAGAFQSKEAIKIWLPSHEVHFKFPHYVVPRLEQTIDELLHDIERSKKTSDPPPRRQRHVQRSEDDIPAPGGWVLVDLIDGCLLHKSVMRGLVVPGGNYVVLALNSTSIQKERLEDYRREISAAEDYVNVKSYAGSVTDSERTVTQPT